MNAKNTAGKWRPQGDSNPCYRRERANYVVILKNIFINLLTICGPTRLILALLVALFIAWPSSANAANSSALPDLGTEPGNNALKLIDNFIYSHKEETSKLSFFGEFIRASYERPSGSLWQQEFAGYPTQWDTRSTGFRIGAEYGLFRLSYFDLGKYHIAAEAADNETAVVACRCMITQGATHWYFTTGSIRGFSLTFRPKYKGFFIEAGPGMFRQSFRETKDDGYYFQERLWGFGYVAGIGFEYKKVSFGVYSYQSTLAGKFDHGSTPTGTGGAYIYSVGYKF